MSNVTASYNQAKGQNDKAWVNETSKLLIGNAQNDADLDAMGVKNVTNIGGVIANATKNSDGTLTDHGKLNYSGELELKDIEDHNYNSSSGFNISGNVGIPQGGTKKASTAPKGSTTIGLNSSGQETEQLTKATMGQGTVKNTTDTTNRDINNAQEITRDQTTGMLDGSVTVDHRLLTDDGRKEIIQDHEDVANQIKDIVAATQGVIASVEFAKEYEVSTQNMTVDEKNTLDNLLQSLQVESKDNTSTWVVVAAEGVAIAGSTCARVPACVSAVVNLFGAATASAILNSGEEKKETHPKGVPSTSGSSATGMPPNGDDDEKINIREPNPRHNSQSVKQNSTTKGNNTVVTRSVNMKEDTRLISNGGAKNIGRDSKTGDLLHKLPNGRIYAQKSDGQLYPHSGPGVHALDRGAYNALGVYNKFGRTEKAEAILKSMNINPQARSAALKVLKENGK